MISFDSFMEKAGRKLSPDQMAVVKSNIATVVSAGAGSGKTTVLSYRFIRLVLERKAHVDEILTLTFTKKAASEMYGRIYSLLRMLADDDSYIKEEMERFASSSIATLDSFANEIARTECDRYGISRDFEILDPDEETELISNVVETLFKEKDPSFMELAKLVSPSTISKDIFSHLASDITIITDFDAETERNKYKTFLNRIEKIYLDYASSVLDEIEKMKTPDMDGIFLFDRNDPDSIYEARKTLESGNYSRLIPFNLQKLRKKSFMGIKSAIKDAWRPAASLLSAIRENMDSDTFYFDAFSRFSRRLNSEKRRLGKLNFSDTADLALRILMDVKSVRSFYKRKFRYIMIDEFQDNSAKQRDFLYILSEREDLDGLGIPAIADLDNTKLFFVGDDKQSIYSFRGADVSVFNSLKDEILSIGGAFLSMRENYRSEPGLVEHFNQIFPYIFTETELHGFGKVSSSLFCRNGSYEASFEPIIARSRLAESRIVLAESDILRISSSSAKEDAEDVHDTENADNDGDGEYLNDAENEAEFIASYITGIVSDPSFSIPGENGILRKPAYDDIAVLYRTSRSQMPLEKTLRRMGIPYTVVSSNSITTEAISYDILAFLSILIFPEDKESYLAVLRSPFIRLGDDAILSISDAFSGTELAGEPFTQILSSFSAGERKKMNDLRAFYCRLKMEAGRLSAEKILDILYFESGYSAYIESKMSLSSYREHYEYLWEEARKAGDIFSFRVFLKSNIGTPSKLDIELLRLSAKGVNLINIHKSKGLEFPIVILAGTNSTAKGRTSSAYMHDDTLGITALDMISSGTKDAKSLRSILSDEKARREEAEKKRLFYVALTRAESHLVLVASGKKAKEGSFYSMYRNALHLSGAKAEETVFRTLKEGDIENIWEKPNDFPQYYGKVPLERGEAEEGSKGIKALSHENDERYDVTGSYPSLKALAYDLDQILDRYSAYSDFGSLVHAKIDSYFRKVMSPNYSNSLLSSKELILFNKVADEMVESFVSSEFFRKYIAPHKVKSEERFYSYSDSSLLEGSMDLIVFLDDFNLVVDYKTDKEKNPDFHKAQILGYIKGAEEIYRKKCFGLLLYLRDMSAGPIWDINGREVKGI